MKYIYNIYFICMCIHNIYFYRLMHVIIYLYSDFTRRKSDFKIKQFFFSINLLKSLEEECPPIIHFYLLQSP